MQTADWCLIVTILVPATLFLGTIASVLGWVIMTCSMTLTPVLFAMLIVPVVVMIILQPIPTTLIFTIVILPAISALPTLVLRAGVLSLLITYLSLVVIMVATIQNVMCH